MSMPRPCARISMASCHSCTFKARHDPTFRLEPPSGNQGFRLDERNCSTMNEENKISVVINTYNAEKFLSQVLDAVKGFDEIVVCDMESTDQTIEIAQKHDCRILTFPKDHHVSAEPARTFAIQHASFKWVLVVDADEIVTPELRNYLYRRIKEPDCPQGIYIPRQNKFMNVTQNGRIGDYQLRFFIRKGTIWPPYVHTFPQVKGRMEKVNNQDKRQNVKFVHLAENYIYETVERKNRYSENEVLKKADKNYSTFALIYRPVWYFFKIYFLNGQLRYGVPGFIHSVMEAFYQFLIAAKIIEQRQRDQQKKS